MYSYQLNNRYFAQVADELEELGIEEISELGATNICQAYRGMYFTADPATLYRINYTSRIVSRVLAPLITFPCHDTDILYKKAKAIRWRSFFNPDQTFAIFATVSNSSITHSQYAGLCLKDAIADHFRDLYKKRPNVEPIHPDIWFNLHVENNQATISVDTSGGSLHRRGYRIETVEAPMQETVAAAIIRYTQWDGTVPLCDPLCGSGTLLAEALMQYCKIPAAWLRSKFGFQCLPDFDPGIWKKVKDDCDRSIQGLPKDMISGSDLAPRAIFATRKNLKQLPHHENIRLTISDFGKIQGINNKVIICNPPYGIRVKTETPLPEFYKELGDFLKQKCQGSSAFIYFGNRDMIKQIGLKPSWKKPLKSGGLDGRLVKYEMY